FDVVHRALFRRRSRQGVCRFVRPGRHVVEAITDDAQTLAHFFDTDDTAVIRVAVDRRRYVERNLIVASIWTAFAQIPVESSRARPGPGHAHWELFLRVVSTDADGTPLQIFFLHHHFFVVTKPRRQIVDKVAHHTAPTRRQILRDAADAKPTRVHAPAGNRL